MLIIRCNKKFNESKVVTTSYNHKKVLKTNYFSYHKNYSQYDNQDWINAGLVIPKLPKKSPLIRSLKGFNHGSKRNMPPTPNKELTPQELEVLYTWISGLEEKNNRKQVAISDFSLVPFKAKTAIDKQQHKHRCYEQITQMPFTLSTKFNNCESLLKNLKNNRSERNLSIIRNIQQLHAGWFDSYNFHTNNENWGTYEVLDVGTPALYFTDVFINQKGLEQVFKRTFSPKAIRSNKKQEYLIFKPSDNYKIPVKRRLLVVGNDKTRPSQWNPKPELVQTGELIKIDNWLPGVSKVDNYYKNDLERDPVKVNADFHRGLGGGVMGDKTYLTLNFGHSSGTIMDGQAKVMRSWSKAVFKELLCRDLPVIDGQDSVSFINEKSPLSFQRNQSCLHCHASINTLTGLTRNFTLGLNNLLSKTVNPESNKAINLQITIPINTKEILDISTLTTYNTSKPSKKFYYQDNKSKLHNKTISNLDSLNNYLLHLNNFYKYITKKYIKHLTRHNINLNTLYYESKNITQAYLKKLIIKKSQNLKKHKSLVNLTNNILNSTIYQDLNFEVTH